MFSIEMGICWYGEEPQGLDGGKITILAVQTRGSHVGGTAGDLPAAQSIQHFYTVSFDYGRSSCLMVLGVD